MIPEREREALMRLTMCAREECRMCKYEDTCDYDFQYNLATESMNILADALRVADTPQTDLLVKTPQKSRESHEKNCETCRDKDAYERGKRDAWKIAQAVFDSTVTLYEAEDVVKWIAKDTNVRSKDCETCNHYHPDHEAIACERCLDGKYSRYEPKTESQEEYINNLPWTEVGNGEQPDCEACELDGKADVCKICRASNYEPQTDCAWK